MNERIPALVAAATFATVGVASLLSGPATAGCGVTIEVHNLRDGAITVDWEDSDSRSGVDVFGTIVPGTWRRLLTDTTNHILPGDTESRAVVLDVGCNVLRQYRIEINEQLQLVVRDDRLPHPEHVPRARRLTGGRCGTGSASGGPQQRGVVAGGRPQQHLGRRLGRHAELGRGRDPCG